MTEDGRRWGSPGEATSGGVFTTSIWWEDGDDEVLLTEEEDDKDARPGGVS